MHAVEVRGLWKSFDAAPVLRDVSVAVAPGAVLALLGPSGCGKTTLLRTIAGLEVPDAGQIEVGGRLLTDGADVVPPERRQVGMVFQDWALFPHLTVAGNVGYGLPRAERRSSRVDEALAMVGLEGLGGRMPGTLSGGQQQRVALARALAPRPSVLLLDEPFSNLDTALRVQVRSEVHRLLGDLGITTIFVTHDQDEAFILGDEVAVMSAGEVVQQGSPAEIYDDPASPWVASFVGEANLLPATVSGDAADTPIGRVALRHAIGAVPALVLVRPEDVAVDAGDAATVAAVEYYGHDTVYQLDLDGLVVRARATGAPQHRRGDTVGAAYAGGPAVAWPAPGGVAAWPAPGGAAAWPAPAG